MGYTEQFLPAISAKDSFPASSALTGTVTTDAYKEYLTGSGTAFTTELEVGDWIVDLATNDECRKVINIISDTELRVDRAFTSTISGGAIKKVGKERYSMVSFQGLGDFNLDGEAQETGGSVTLQRSFESRRVDPVVVEPNGANVRVSVKL